MMETISVLLVFLILMTFVVIFYINVSSSSAQAGREDLFALKAVEISQLISYMPEFQCSSKNIVDENCFDILKLQAFIDYNLTTIGSRAMSTSYFDLFEFSRIEVKEIYPLSGNHWVIYDRKPNRTRVSFRNSYIPISLYNATGKFYAIGLLNVTIYS
ncbi:MAG: hypothetical protein ACMXYG_07155 [Candidatus Woesearchaeota archaeon]